MKEKQNIKKIFTKVIGCSRKVDAFSVTKNIVVTLQELKKKIGYI